MKKIKLRVIDTETTGLYLGSGDDVIEIGYIDVEIDESLNYKFINEYRQLLKPKKKDFPRATQVHGLKYSDLIESPDSKVFMEQQSYIEQDILFLGQNIISYDNKALKINESLLIDTLILARKLLPKKSNPGLANHKNETLYDFLNGSEIYQIDKAKLHGAITDCYATFSIFIQLLKQKNIPFDDIPKLVGKEPELFTGKKVSKSNQNKEENKGNDYIPKLVDKIGFGTKSEEKWSDVNDNYIKFYIGNGSVTYGPMNDIESFDPITGNLNIDRLYTLLTEAVKRAIFTEKGQYLYDKFFKQLSAEGKIPLKYSKTYVQDANKADDIENQLKLELDDNFLDSDYEPKDIYIDAKNL